ncbi:MAG TPA: ectonucleotide pyrophosphatase/phosphodiesterase [Polyangiales bacterium]|nr:ectonucleotide pyrophosphatase/phosphodiesterase [Polyangiales bacterium]
MRLVTRVVLAVLAVFTLSASVLGVLWWSYRGEYPSAPIVKRQRAFKPLAIGPAVAPSDRIVVLLVFDGLAPELVRAVPTPNLDRMKRDGAYTLALQPVFPTLSMPNHTSLSTGCYPERHGVVSNRFVDPVRGLYAENLGDALWLEGCEHLTEVAERQGVRVADFGWVGAHRGEQLLVSEGGPYEEFGMAIEPRIDQVTKAIAASAQLRSRLILSYVDEPDHTLHPDGLTAPSSRAVMTRIDAAIGRVLDAIDAAGLRERTALIVTTDHGMIAAGDHINLEGILRRASIDALFVADATTAHVYLHDPSTRDAAAKLLAEHAQQLEVLVPERSLPLHMGRSKRLGDLTLNAKPPYYMFDRGIWPQDLRFAAPFAPDILPDHRLKGMHGYHQGVPGVQAVLFASGAGVAHGAVLDGMRSIDVHPTIAALLGIAPGVPVDGTAYRPLLLAAQ